MSRHYFEISKYKSNKFLVISFVFGFFSQILNIYVRLGLYIDVFFGYICDYIVIGINIYPSHHKFHGSQFGNNSSTKFAFHWFVWNRHGCHSSSCIV
jgi:hypothetical protein